ncbi:MAG: hypothetical protein NTZ48_00170 [Candidatus Omnitrophica bacterium]|nr:hypothetical protein [Candidatus Omnitrophota bacterium]
MKRLSFVLVVLLVTSSLLIVGCKKQPNVSKVKTKPIPSATQ